MMKSLKLMVIKYSKAQKQFLVACYVLLKMFQITLFNNRSDSHHVLCNKNNEKKNATSVHCKKVLQKK